MYGVDNCKNKSFVSVSTLKRKENLLICIRKTINTTVSPQKTEDRPLIGRPRQSCKNNTHAVLPVRSMKAYKWCRSIDPLILYLSTKWSGWLHVLAALPPRKEPRYRLNRRLREPQSRSGLLQNRNISYACTRKKVVSCEPGASDSGKTRLADTYQQRQERLVPYWAGDL